MNPRIDTTNESANEIAAKENDKQKLDKRRGAQMRVTMPEMEEVDCLRILLSTLALLADTIRPGVGGVLESWPTGTKLRVYTRVYYCPFILPT